MQSQELKHKLFLQNC